MTQIMLITLRSNDSIDTYYIDRKTEGHAYRQKGRECVRRERDLLNCRKLPGAESSDRAKGAAHAACKTQKRVRFGSA
jgi:hypothetical protein